MKILHKIWNDGRDLLIGAALFVLALALYLRTLAPSVVFLFDDTLEFQYIIPRLGIVHQTGYPFYTLLGKLFTLLVPLNDPAFRLNLLSALNGALAVGMVYLVLRHLAAFRLAAIIGALTFSVGQTFWSQAVVAETYTLQMLIAALLLYLALRWHVAASSRGAQESNSNKNSPRDDAAEVESGNATNARRRPRGSAPAMFYALAFVMGLGLTHHRLILLLYPAIALYVLLVRPSILRDLRLLSRAAILFVLPFLFYLYLPLRGAVGSADGTYQNTLQGFFAWITAQEYTVFLTQNPFQVQRDAAFYAALFQNQFGIPGLALAAIGAVWLLRKPREWILLVAALIAEAGFAFNYRVANVHVHFLTTFLLLALFAGAGADALLTAASNWRSGIGNSSRAIRYVLLLLLCALLLLIPLNLLNANYATNDLSNKWAIHDYGVDILTQPFENNATVIGILGEMTLLRYFQETQRLRPDVQTIAADKEDARLAAIENALKQNRVVYLTRPLKGAAEKYSLASFGPLIRVNAQPVPGDKNANLLGEDFGAGIKFLGSELDASRLTAISGRWHAENGRLVRVTLHWFPTEKIDTDAMVSLKILPKDQRVVGQVDHRPVLDAYPTTAWRAGEVIVDTYDVPIFLGAPPGDYAVNVTMYDAHSGAVIGRRDLTQIALAPDLIAPRREVWNIAHTADVDFGVLSLAGYSLDADAPVRPGDALPLTLLWRADSGTKAGDDLKTRVWLEDSEGKSVASRGAAMSAGFPPSLWQPNEYVRDWPLIRVPANVADGKYSARLAVARDNQLLGASSLPFRESVVDLGQVEIKNRARVMAPPPILHPLEATFDQKIKMLGYAVNVDAQQRMVRLTLYWKSLTLLDASYSVFVHLLDASNAVRASGDAVPGGGEFPTTGWIENEYITDAHSFSIPADLPTGAYQIEIGLYDPASDGRLKTAGGQDRVLVEPINVP